MKYPLYLLMATALISYLQLYRPIPEPDVKLISAAFKPQHLKEGDTLFNGDGICRDLFFICNGVLRIIMNNAEGRQVTHYFLKETQFCTILNSFTNQVPASEKILAACNTEVLTIRRKALFELYEQVPYLQELINQITQQALLDKIRIRNTYLGQDAATKYQLFLTQQADIATRVSQSDIASYLSITPQSLSRIRKSMH